MVENNQKSRSKYWATRSSVCLFAHTAHSFACSELLASLARFAALTRLLARSLTHARSRGKECFIVVPESGCSEAQWADCILRFCDFLLPPTQISYSVIECDENDKLSKKAAEFSSFFSSKNQIGIIQNSGAKKKRKKEKASRIPTSQ